MDCPSTKGSHNNVPSTTKIRVNTCFVPMCQSNSITHPNKLFLTAPKNPTLRAKWFEAAKSDEQYSLKTVIRCCEDHFDMEKDVENWMKFRMFGGNLYLKKDVVPHFFQCQNRMLPKPRSITINGQEILKDIEKAQSHTNSGTNIYRQAVRRGNNMNFETVFVKVELEAETLCVQTEAQEPCVKIDPAVVTVKQEPLCTDNISAGMSLANANHPHVTHMHMTGPIVTVKQETLFMDTIHASTNQTVTCTESYATDINNEAEAVDMIKPVCVKEEPLSENHTSLCAGETAWAKLYAKHEIKEELVVSPESMQRPIAASSLTEALIKVEERTPDGIWSVKPERAPEDTEPLQHGGTDTPSTITKCQCSHCGKDLGNHIRKHIQTHSTSGPSAGKDIGPDSCGSTTEELLEIEHSHENYMCPECDYATPLKKSFETHSKRHTDKKTQNIHTNKNIFKCSYCGLSCSRKADLHKHEMTHTGEKPYKCSSCDYKSSRKADLLMHQRTHTGEKPFQCSECDYKCNRKDSLHRHQVLHASEKPFKCTLCDFESYQKANLRVHQRIHTGEKSFECSYCDFKCRHKYTLQTHQMRHTGEKPYNCSSCNYRCSRKSDLRKHQTTHSADKPFKCNECNFACRQKGDLAKHKKRHTGEKLFHCGTCDYKCSRDVDLRRHQKIHMDAKLFKCNHCSYVSLHKNSLKRHIKCLHTYINT